MHLCSVQYMKRMHEPQNAWKQTRYFFYKQPLSRPGSVFLQLAVTSKQLDDVWTTIPSKMPENPFHVCMVEITMNVEVYCSAEYNNISFRIIRMTKIIVKVIESGMYMRLRGPQHSLHLITNLSVRTSNYFSFDFA